MKENQGQESMKEFIVVSPFEPINLTIQAFLRDSKLRLNSASIEIDDTFSTIFKSSKEISVIILFSASSGDLRMVLLAIFLSF